MLSGKEPRGIVVLSCVNQNHEVCTLITTLTMVFEPVQYVGQTLYSIVFDASPSTLPSAKAQLPLVEDINVMAIVMGGVIFIWALKKTVRRHDPCTLLTHKVVDGVPEFQEIRPFDS